jgi:hypothetical protein
MGLLEILLIIVLIMWLGGFSLGVGGSAVHILLLVVLVIVVIRLLNRSSL